MFQRRQFLGSIAAICAATGVTPRLSFAANHAVPDLNWDCQIIETMPLNRAHRTPVVTGVSLQNAGELLAIVGDDHHVGLYDRQQQNYIRHLDRHTDWIRSSQFSPDGSLLATAGNDRTLCIWNTSDWEQPRVVKKHPEAIIHVAFSNDGTQLATVGFDSWLRVYNASSGEQISKLKCACPDNHAVAFSNDDQLIAVGGRCGTIRIWNSRNNVQSAEFAAHRKRIRTIEFSSNRHIVSAGDDQIVTITNPDNINSPRSLPRSPTKFYATALLDNNVIAVGGSDNKIHLWSLDNLQPVGSLKGHTGTVTSLDWSGTQLVSGSYDTHVRIWSTERHTSALEQRHTELPQSNGWNQKLK